MSEARARDLFRSFNAGDIDDYLEGVADDCVLRPSRAGGHASELRGKDEIRNWFGLVTNRYVQYTARIIRAEELSAGWVLVEGAVGTTDERGGGAGELVFWLMRFDNGLLCEARSFAAREPAEQAAAALR